LLGQKKPIAAPSHVTRERKDSVGRPRCAIWVWHLDRDVFRLPETRHVLDRDRAVLIEGRGDYSDRRLDSMLTGLDAAQVRQRDDQADCAMPAHAEIADVV